MNKGELQLVKSVIKSIIVSSPTAVTIYDLAADYKKLEGCDIPYMSLGYRSLEDFLRSMSDSIQVVKIRGQVVVQCAPNAKSGHIQKLVMEQKNTSSSKKKNTSHPPRLKCKTPYQIPTITRKLDNFQHSALQNRAPSKSRDSIKSQTVTMVPLSLHRNVNYIALPDTKAANARNLSLVVQNKENNHVARDSTPKNSQTKTVDLQKTVPVEIQTREYTKKKSLYSLQYTKNEIHDNQSELSNKSMNDSRTTTVELVKTAPGIIQLEENSKQEAVPLLQYMKNKICDNPVHEEAVPLFNTSMNDIVGVGLPNPIVKYGQSIDLHPLPGLKKMEEIHKIRITEVYNPHMFWFQIESDFNDLRVLMSNMEEFYGETDSKMYAMPVAQIQCGQICAALRNNKWYRGRILSSAGNDVKVHLIDFGKTVRVPISHIKYLIRKFSELPALVLRGSLSHIKPLGARWHTGLAEIFAFRVVGVTTYGQLFDVDIQTRTHYFVICKGTQQINKYLIDTTAAVFDSEWQSSKNDRQHYQLCPTFSMIEEGKYPSLFELKEMQTTMGLNYESIIQSYVGYYLKNPHKPIPEDKEYLPYKLRSNPFFDDICNFLKDTLKI